MNNLPTQFQGILHQVRDLHKNASDFTGAIAGLASAIAVLFGLIAAHYGPHGFGKLAMLAHLHRAPLIVRLAPVVTGIAVFIATSSGILRFYSWYRERHDDGPHLAALNPGIPTGRGQAAPLGLQHSDLGPEDGG